jgi:hypothetical protein
MEGLAGGVKPVSYLIARASTGALRVPATMTSPLKTFRVRLPVLLDIEVQAVDPLTALETIDIAFTRADPLNTPTVRLVPQTSLAPMPRARVLDARAQGPARMNDSL